MSRNDPKVQLSKFLSSVLRHNAQKMGLEIRSDGGVLLSKILELPKFRNMANAQRVIEDIVATNEKQRFTIFRDPKNNLVYIRANQGHSLKVENLDLKKVVDPNEIPTAIHGTYFSKWEIIWG
ncbi:hypothetical protein BB559_001394 [Furculomyces boomerangus]|uniref:2'-phosphotransferase n=2 Tax=Harpellales TaxID=61421 RepID=A0A2T9YGL3_9FUNG|nr:hypothetical protein BB559_004147 [Furculomyces boomerangus]PVU98677.1 hypothetical protein BB559_001394 [Furculomyces boomerangus]PVZ98553.1 hypothetical protein BB558_005456 [Smittium angustum]